MQTTMLVLIGIAMLMTLGVLFTGLLVMARGGSFNAKWGNKLMRYRIVCQGVALALFAVALLVGKGG
ncbi:twin transmembrane helix small protein [Algihabitans albus]|uniref:twin transmembrane helix small protein n=1 Tax=Algihabitans albus TaxID=2164067 RepID=UPI000E5CDF9A|nr:twin transmembrane helix small protein [Algihabitans albus]